MRKGNIACRQLSHKQNHSLQMAELLSHLILIFFKLAWCVEINIEHYKTAQILFWLAVLKSGITIRNATMQILYPSPLLLVGNIITSLTCNCKKSQKGNKSSHTLRLIENLQTEWSSKGGYPSNTCLPNLDNIDFLAEFAFFKIPEGMGIFFLFLSFVLLLELQHHYRHYLEMNDYITLKCPVD